MNTSDRFQRSRWSETRKQIDTMLVEQTHTFSADQYFNAKASVDRLNDAYTSKRWCMTTVSVQGQPKRRISIVTRIK